MTSQIINSIDELKDGDEYQTKYLMADYWSIPKIYSSNICQSKKEDLIYLINHNRVRVIKTE